RGEPALAFFREGQHVAELRAGRLGMQAQLLDRLRAVEAVAIKDAENLFHAVDLFGGEAVALESDPVDRAHHHGGAVAHEKRRHVVTQLGVGRQHGIGADATELVDAGVGAEHDVVLHRGMAGEPGVVAHDDMAAKHAVVRHVAVGQDGVVGADHGQGAVVRAGMDGDIFAKDVPVADAHAGAAALEFQVLGLAADAGIGKHLAILPQNGVALDARVVMKARAVAERDVAADVGEGTDFDIATELSRRFDNGGGMNFGGHGMGHSTSSLSRMANINSAEETTWPATLQVPSAQAILSPRLLVNLTLITNWSPGRTALRNLTLSQLMSRA